MNEMNKRDQEKQLLINYVLKNKKIWNSIKNNSTASKEDLYEVYNELQKFIIENNLDEHSYDCYILTILHKLLNNINAVTEDEIILIKNIISIITSMDSELNVCDKYIITNVELLNDDILIEKVDKDGIKIKCTDCIRHMVLR